MKKVIRNRSRTIKKKYAPTSGIILAILLLSTFLTVFAVQQQQENRSHAATTTPTQQACGPNTTITNPQILDGFCAKNPTNGICLNLCKGSEVNGAPSKDALCQAGGVYACATASGGNPAGTCQTGACATSPHTGINSYCGGGQTCCDK